MTIAPKISVCIPAFNAERTIERCLRSLLAQDLSKSEVLLVDNCSTDKTCEIAAQILAQVPAGRIIRNATNVGRVPNWNRCLDEARGEFVKFLFTNDTMLPGALALFYGAAAHDPDVVMVASKARTVDVMPETLPAVESSPPLTKRSNVETLEFFASQGFLTGSLNGMLFRRAPIVEHAVRFRETIPYFADFLHAIELARYGSTVFVDEETYCFDAGAAGRYHFVGMQDPPRFFLEHRECTDRLAQLLRNKGRDSSAPYRYLAGRYLWYLGQGTPLTPGDAWRIFRGRPKTQVVAAFKTFWFARKQSARPLTASVNGGRSLALPREQRASVEQ